MRVLATIDVDDDDDEDEDGCFPILARVRLCVAVAVLARRPSPAPAPSSFASSLPPLPFSPPPLFLLALHLLPPLSRQIPDIHEPRATSRTTPTHPPHEGSPRMPIQLAYRSDESCVCPRDWDGIQRRRMWWWWWWWWWWKGRCGR